MNLDAPKSEAPRPKRCYFVSFRYSESLTMMHDRGGNTVAAQTSHHHIDMR